MSKINTFEYNGKTYVKVTPVKSLFHSTMVYEVITRGSIFAVNVASGELTIIPGQKELHSNAREYKLTETKESKEAASVRAIKAQEARQALKQLVMDL